ncbi:hypothetical protein PY74_13880 [Lacticaseibacillus rhamnosus]|nr:hypothetical protein PY66_00725 [Lacticaseibacillus rhamnosus]OAU70735.1 hypothetical protein PY74_13880 [Lacticaseibacillus rhamnosus]
MLIKIRILWWISKKDSSGPCQTPQSPARWGGDAKLERRRRLEPARPAVSKSPNNISDKARSLCCSTAESHLAYDCSALALGSLKSIYTNARNLKIEQFLVLIEKLFDFILKL